MKSIADWVKHEGFPSDMRVFLAIALYGSLPDPDYPDKMMVPTEGGVVLGYRILSMLCRENTPDEEKSILALHVWKKIINKEKSS